MRGRRRDWFGGAAGGGFGPGGWSGFGWGPWHGRGSFFRPGEVRLALLSLLSEGEAHGYELMKRLEQRSGGVYQASAGTIYPVLQQLEDEGLATSETRDGKKVYRITDAGRAELARETEAVEGIWHRAGRWREWGAWMGPETAEVATAVGRVIKASFRAAAAGGPAVAEQVEGILERARRELDDLTRA